MIAFRGADGRTLTLEEIKKAPGEYRFEILGDFKVPAEAEKLHKQAREAGGRNDLKLTISLLNKASKLAPQWPYPIYDRAYAHLLLGEFGAALRDYQKTVALAPRGFWTAITAVDILTREKNEEFPLGTYLYYLSVEWENDMDKKVSMLVGMVNRLPRFAPAWKDLATFAAQDSQKLEFIENGLSANPDAEMRGGLLILKASTLNHQGHHEEAVQILGSSSSIRGPLATPRNWQGSSCSRS